MPNLWDEDDETPETEEELEDEELEEDDGEWEQDIYDNEEQGE